MFPLAPKGETKEEEKSFRCWFLEAKGETSQEMGEKQFPFLEEEVGMEMCIKRQRPPRRFATASIETRTKRHFTAAASLPPLRCTLHTYTVPSKQCTLMFPPSKRPRDSRANKMTKLDPQPPLDIQTGPTTDSSSSPWAKGRQKERWKKCPRRLGIALSRRKATTREGHSFGALCLALEWKSREEGEGTKKGGSRKIKKDKRGLSLSLSSYKASQAWGAFPSAPLSQNEKEKRKVGKKLLG